MELFEKFTSPGGKVSYKPYVEPEPTYALPDNMTEGEILSAVAGLAVVAMHGYQMLLPDHCRVYKKADKVKSAVLEMFAGTGKSLAPEIVERVCDTWTAAMKMMEGNTP